MAIVAAARSMFRSPSVRNAASRISSEAKAARSPFRTPSRSPLSHRIFRCPSEMSACLESLQPFHTVTASALMTSKLTDSLRSYSWLSEGIQRKTESKIYSNQHSILGLNVCSACNVGSRCFLHSGSPKEAETGNNSRPMDFVGGLTEESTRRSPSGAALNNSRPMDFVRGRTEEYTKRFPSGAPLSRYHMEQDADIVHIKVMRNNAFVTVTDSKGNKKFGASAGKLTGKGGKVARYAAESTAEHVGREARDRGLGSVVVKVNGFTYFKKKKQAILSFREGYTHSRGDKNPVVYIEDTTRKPHNGCRLSKKRRI